MENNTIHPDEMDRLLRETFLDSDFAETDAVTDLMAKQAFNTAWPAVPPVAKEAAIIGKKGFFAGFSLNTILGGALVTGLGVAGGGYLLLNGEGQSSAPLADAHIPALVQVLPVPEPIFEPVQEPVAQTAPAATHTYRPKPKTVPVAPPENSPEVTAVVPADTAADLRAKSGNAKPPLDKPRQNRYILLPTLSPEDIYENEKRKRTLIRQVVNEDKKEWAYIPTGTTHINGEAVSVQGFFMQVHEVTNLQYKTYLYDLIIHNRLHEYRRAAVHDSAWLGYHGLEPMVQNYFWHPLYNEYPVVNVSPEGALLYTVWLTNQVNAALGYKTKINDIRLPTQEEWIYAAKADDDSAVYAWSGKHLRNARGNVLANYRSPMNEDGSDLTAIVTSYPPNGWGLYNMCGNVAELTHPTGGTHVNVMGGSWAQTAEYLELLHENRIPVNKLPLPSVGFRVVYTYLNEK